MRVLKINDVKFIASFIPVGHRHTRVLINMGNEILVLQQAVVDALIRAYVSVALHPYRKVLALRLRRLSRNERKEGFADYQLVEVEGINEDRLLGGLSRLYFKYLRSKDDKGIKA